MVGCADSAAEGDHSLSPINTTDYRELTANDLPNVVTEQDGSDQWQVVACRYKEQGYPRSVTMYAWRNERPVLIMSHARGDHGGAPASTKNCNLGWFKLGDDPFVILDEQTDDPGEIADNLINWGASLSQLYPYIARLQDPANIDEHTDRVLSALASGDLWIGACDSEYVRPIQMPTAERSRIAHLLWRKSGYTRSDWLIEAMKNNQKTKLSKEVYDAWNNERYRMSMAGTDFDRKMNLWNPWRKNLTRPETVSSSIIQNIAKAYGQAIENDWDESMIEDELDWAYNVAYQSRQTDLIVSLVKHVYPFPRYYNRSEAMGHLIKLLKEGRHEEAAELADALMAFPAQFPFENTKHSLCRKVARALVANLGDPESDKAKAYIDGYPETIRDKVDRFVKKWHFRSPYKADRQDDE